MTSAEGKAGWRAQRLYLFTGLGDPMVKVSYHTTFSSRFTKYKLGNSPKEIASVSGLTCPI